MEQKVLSWLDFVSKSLFIPWINSCVTLKYLKPGSDVIRFHFREIICNWWEDRAGGRVRCQYHSVVFIYNSLDYGFGLGCWVIPSAGGERAQGNPRNAIDSHLRLLQTDGSSKPPHLFKT